VGVAAFQFVYCKQLENRACPAGVGAARQATISGLPFAADKRIVYDSSVHAWKGELAERVLPASPAVNWNSPKRENIQSLTALSTRNSFMH
jgi:hypothetical protein